MFAGDAFRGSWEGDAPKFERMSKVPGLRCEFKTLKSPFSRALHESRAPLRKPAFSCTIECDANFDICAANQQTCDLLMYEPKDLIGKSILDLMPKMIADVHKHMFADLKRMDKKKLSDVAKRLKRGMSCCREFAILDARRNPIVCVISVDMNTDLSSSVHVNQVQSQLLHTIPRGYESYINAWPKCHVSEFDDVICVMMDIAGSTQFSVNRPPRLMAELLCKANQIVHEIVLRDAFPYCYVHELVGDSMLLIVNAGFMARCPGQAAQIALSVAQKAQKSLDYMLADYSDEMFIRVGIASGTVAAGVVDGRNFRVFGTTVHMSQRLEACCTQKHILCSMAVADELELQGALQHVNCTIKEMDLKGLGKTRCVDVKDRADLALMKESKSDALLGKLFKRLISVVSVTVFLVYGMKLFSGF
eukprot:TRINITY_DN58098_c0_g1_i1.p1 TRINITY_DN58098_c0_g1~~TRINITY_DN58098_c0_g1_i1.p1  ORF type:complete len:419 (+),score=85.37 TRINITY_DN58098_c0_g1_i1:27-1283(+)